MARSAVGQPLTLSENFETYEYESFLFEGLIDESWKAYWAAHSAFNFLLGDDDYSSLECFSQMQQLVTNGLQCAGYGSMANDLSTAPDETEFNAISIGQYTSESTLYERVNALLRKGHDGISIAKDPLAPWIAHLNAILRREEEYLHTAYRGADLTASEVAEYKPGRLFIWTSFTSMSKRRECCLDGNTLFEITPRSSISMHGKRAPRSIAHFSDFPEEDEVLLPLAAAFRVESREATGTHRTIIKLTLLDHN